MAEKYVFEQFAGIDELELSAHVVCVDYVSGDGVSRRGWLEGVSADGVLSVLSLSGNDDEIGAADVVALWHRGQLVVGVRS